MRYIVEEVDYSTIDERRLAPILARVNELNREAVPRTVDLSSDEFRVRTRAPGTVARFHVARNDGGEVVGFCDTRFPDDGSNPHVLRCQIRVVPKSRRQGIGTRLLGHAARIAEGLGRSRLLSWHSDTVPAGIHFAREVGAAEKLQFHENVLRIPDLDREMLTEWVDAARSRTPDYTLHMIEGAYPEELLEDVARLHHILERDAPISEGYEPREWTADLMRDQMGHDLRSSDVLTAIVKHDESDRTVGMSQLSRRHGDPSTWVVTVTMVDPEHRGHGLGKWLKGAVNLTALETWPGGLWEETGNAFTNDAMLSINRAMGFEHELTLTEVELKVADALSYAAANR